MCDNGSSDAHPRGRRGLRGPGAGAARRRRVGRPRRRARAERGAAAGGDLIAYCDGDDEVTDGWLDALVARPLATRTSSGGALDHRSLNDPDLAALRGGAETELPRAFGFLPYAISANMAVLAGRRGRPSAAGTRASRARPARTSTSPGARSSPAGRSRSPPTPSRATATATRCGDSRPAGLRVRRLRRPALPPLPCRRRAHGARSRRSRRAWAFLAYAPPVPGGLSRRRRGSWLVLAAENAGRIRGSIRHRVFCP